MEHRLVIGASGFLGKHVALALHEKGYTVRCSARDLSRVQSLAAAECETVRADISDDASLKRALNGIEAVYILIHTLSPQTANAAGQSFMDVEMAGLQNIVMACKAQGVHRLIYVTFLGVAADAPSEWIRGRWKAENSLLKSGLDVTVIRPGQIVGVGGSGFNTMVSQAKQALSVNMFGNGKQRMRNIAIDDLVYYLVGVLGDSRGYGKIFDMGCDDVLTYNQMLDVAAEVLGRRHPAKFRSSASDHGHARAACGARGEDAHRCNQSRPRFVRDRQPRRSDADSSDFTPPADAVSAGGGTRA